ncbi:outer membrane beta-barrel protein [Flavobacterium sp. GT3R68]|uniref:outer membrane beta-barrel protein n=1 Tax=Flavobacterium sp. GT3R68 TaxID=2594437 RepID=UPI000F89AE51|nr:outer membrane beta-barrel protein [Flavobacterium sp. GT3R68]RTY89661.1 porin family protein [Flavobacterium sp. GSN2]TRW89453.1 porin family protein [Flavobacterium sp. GT3R68]
MKKVIFTVAAIFAFGFANAQETKVESTGGKGFSSGDIFMSGSVGISSTSEGDDKFNSYTVSPKLGFFVSDNIAIGAKIGFTGTKTEDASPLVEDIKTSELSLGAFGRYYTTPASDFSFFAELGANFTNSKIEENGAPDDKETGFNIAFAPGVSYFISNNFALEASIGVLSYDTNKPDNGGNPDSTDTVNFGLNLSDISLGLVYKF